MENLNHKNPRVKEQSVHYNNIWYIREEKGGDTMIYVMEKCQKSTFYEVPKALYRIREESQLEKETN